jgi:hypothetical protein
VDYGAWLAPQVIPKMGSMYLSGEAAIY